MKFDRPDPSSPGGVAVAEPAHFQVQVHPPVPSCSTGGVARVVVAGEVDMAATGALSRALARAGRLRGVDVIQVDLTAATFLDAAAIGAMLAARNAVVARRKQLTVCGAIGLPRRMLEITGALGVLGGKHEA
jgi:anti-anti-sigma factor